MTKKIEEMATEVMVVDIANTKDIGRKVEVAFREAANRGVMLTIKYENFPVLNQYKNLPNDLQIAIAWLVSDKIDLERKLAAIKLDQAFENSFKNRQLKSQELAQIIKIVDEERGKNQGNYWGPAKERCVEYLKSINSDKSKTLRVQSKQVFAQYIARNRKKLNGN